MPLLIALVAAAALAGSPPAGASGLQVVQHIAIGGPGGWDYASYDPAKRRIYVAHGAAISALDIDTGAVNPALAVTQRAHQPLPVNGGTELLITDGGPATASLIDAATGAVRASLHTSPGPDAAIVEPTTGLALVMGNKSGDVTLIDIKAGKVVEVIPVGGALEYAAADGKGRVFINVEDRNEIAVLDMASRHVSAHYRLAGCDEPTGLAYIGQRGWLLAACGNGIGKVVRASDGKTVADLKIGPHPDAALYDPERRLAYIPSGGSGDLAVISTSGKVPRVIDRVKTAPGARTGTIDLKTGRLYLPSAKFTPPTTASGRPVMVADSFELLVVGK